MKTFQTSFSGQMLERGFWLYVWRIRHKKNDSEHWYIGRTGDSSSANAASPLGRLSQHLNLKDNAKGNSLIRNIKGIGLKPKECQFKLVAVGPLFPEQSSLAKHMPYRDIMARLEAEIAQCFRDKGRSVLGSHPARGDYDVELFNEALSKLNEGFNC